jgi:preprotein translocase subunit SecD
MSKSRVFTVFFAVLILAGFSIYLANPYGAQIFGKNFLFKLGLDLRGGTHLVYKGDLSKLDRGLHSDAMSSVRDVIERRVNAFGVSEPVVAVSGSDRLIIELPGVTNIDEAVRLIGQTPFLEFREENPDFEPPENPEDLDPNLLFLPTQLTGADFERAEVTFSGQQTGIGGPEISLVFNDQGKDLFAEITARNVGRRVAIFLDGELLSAPVVQTAIKDGRAVITGQFSMEEARELVTRLNAGALPVPISLLSQQNVGPTLGKISISKSLIAGLIGLSAVGLFMIIFYGLPGVLAVLALFIYTTIALMLFKLFNITLTLAGIAGFILSIGMAIDANILIFERTKEELRRGKSLGLASIGILVSMFSAITVTRTLLRLLIMIRFFNTPRLFGIKSAQN